MSSNISNYSQNIDSNFPVQGADNPSQGFRDNFAQIKIAFDQTTQEIDALQAVMRPLTTATNASLGGIKIGSGVNITPDGMISVTPYSLIPATTSTLGGIVVGSGLDVTSGIVSAIPYVLTTATTSTLGGIKVGAGLQINANGVLSTTNIISIATSSTVGVVKPGSGISVSTTGSMSANYSNLPVATRSVLGGVKIGSGVTVSGSGTISVATYTLPIATTSALGGVIADGTTILINNGTISASGSVGLASRSTITTSSITTVAANNTATLSVRAYMSYALFKITTNTASWITIYNSSSSLTADASRTQGTDPLPGAGVIAEVITTGNQTIPFTPGVYGWNDTTSTIYMKATNISTQSSILTVSLTLLKLEA